MKHVFFLHSAGSQGLHEGGNDLILWLENELGSEYELLHPIMPSANNPDYSPWKLQLDKEFENVTGDVILIGHSLGGSVLLKYLTANKVHFNIQALYLCASPYWGEDSEWQYQPFALPPMFVELLPLIPNVHIYHSRDDPFVPYRHAELYRDALPNSVLHEIEGDSHVFDNGIASLPGDIRAVSN